MSKMFQVYGIGQALIPVLPPPLPFQNPPTSNQTNYEVGQLVYSPAPIPTSFYLYGGAGNWIEIATSSGGVLSVTGTANQILATPTTGNVVLSLIGPYTPATYTAHGVLMGEGTSSIAASSAGTSGQVFTSGGASADGAYQNIGTNSGLTAHGVVIAEGTGAFAATATGSSGQFFVSGGASADPAWQTATPQLVVTPVAGATQAMTSNHSYIANDSALTTFTLPTTSSVGDILQIVGSALNVNGWKITYTTSQIIWGPAGSSTVTTGNAASATAAAQSVTMSCVVANTTWVITANSGTITLT
jgi:hypothetical protein